MAARWYTPESANFTSRDTWTLNPDPSVQANRYTYANSDPLDNSDPTGHYQCSWTCALAALAGATLVGSYGAAASEYGVYGLVGVGAFAGGYYGYQYYQNYGKTSSLVNFAPSGSGATHPCLCATSGTAYGKTTGYYGGAYGGSVWLPPPPPSLADIQRALEQKEITTPVPRPPTKPGINQNQLNKQRDKVEKTVKAKSSDDNASSILTKIGGAFVPTTDTVAYSPLSGGSGKGGGGPPPPPPVVPDDEGDDYISLYHGTTQQAANDIRQNGIDLSKVNSNVDFGPGFYTTTDATQAGAWAMRAAWGEEPLTSSSSAYLVTSSVNTRVGPSRRGLTSRTSSAR